MDKPKILATLKKGQAIGAVEHFGETFNWSSQWVANIEAEHGLSFKNKDSDHPIITANIISGKGISVTEHNGALKISLIGDDDDDDSDSTNNTNRRSGGGRTGGGTSNSNLNGNDGGGYGGGSGSSSGENNNTDGSGNSNGNDGISGTNCNRFSGDLSNLNSNVIPPNDGDDCDELNGW